eukprot:ANDGO_07588.mRNA.1 Proteasome subunit alpha type-1-B
MFRNSYDTDVTLWSPQGRLFQIEYAMEAVKQGSAAVGLKSSSYVVLASLKRAPHAELSSYQKKIFTVDTHMGIAIAGLTSDARVLSRFMRTECLNHKYVFDAPMPVGRLVLKVADKSQTCTQESSKRPFGVGLLVAGFDETGTHLYQTCPSGNYWDYKAVAIGARSQSAKTYLEKNFDSFASLGKEELVRHALLALRETTGDNVELTTKNTAVSIVGVDTAFTVFEDEGVEPFIQLISAEQAQAQAQAQAQQASAPQPSPMDTE